MQINISTNSLDNKNRLIIPTSHRDILPKTDKVVFMCETDINFNIQSMLAYERRYEYFQEKLMELLASGKITYEEMQKQLDKYNLNTYAQTNIDNNYRITIPELLMDKYQLSKKVLIARSNDHIKIFKNEEDLNTYRTL